MVVKTGVDTGPDEVAGKKRECFIARTIASKSAWLNESACDQL